MEEEKKIDFKEVENKVIGYRRVRNALDEDQYVPITFGKLANLQKGIKDVYHFYVSLNSSLAALNQKYKEMEKKEEFSAKKISDIYLEQIVLQSAIRLIEEKHLYELEISEI